MDSISFYVDYKKKDSNHVWQWVQDTLKFRYRPKKIPKNADYTPATTFKLTSNLEKRKIHFYDLPVFNAPDALTDIDTSKLRLVHLKEDTLEINQRFSVEFTESSVREFVLKSELEQGESYHFFLDSLALKDVYNLVNDSIMYKFVISSSEEYGSLKLVMEGFSEHALVQILDASKKVVSEQRLGKKTELYFENLVPSSYTAQVIIDRNKNNIWDSGDYLKHRQPEEIVFLRKELKVVKNWETEETWLYNSKINLNEILPKR
jgi:hypothetical protein